MNGTSVRLGFLLCVSSAALCGLAASASPSDSRPTLFRFATDQIESTIDESDRLVAFELNRFGRTVARVYRFDGEVHGSIRLPQCDSSLGTFKASTKHSLVVTCQHQEFVDAWTFDMRTGRELAHRKLRGLFAQQTVGGFAAFGEQNPLRLSLRDPVTLAQLAVIHADVEGAYRSLIRFADGRNGVLAYDAARGRPTTSPLGSSSWAAETEWFERCGPVAFDREHKRLETFTRTGSIAHIYQADEHVATVACGTDPESIVGLTYASGSDGTAAADIGLINLTDHPPHDHVIFKDDTNELESLVVQGTVFVHSHTRVSEYDVRTGKLIENVDLPTNKGLFLRNVGDARWVDIFSPSARFELLEPVSGRGRYSVVDVR